MLRACLAICAIATFPLLVHGLQGGACKRGDTGNPFNHHICKDDPLYAELSASLNETCQNFDKKGENVPTSVRKDSVCFWEAIEAGAVPNWMMFFADKDSVPCLIEYGYVTMQNIAGSQGLKPMPFLIGIWRQEWVLNKLILVNDPADRQTVADAPDVNDETDYVTLGQYDNALHLEIAPSITGEYVSDYLRFYWYHYVDMPLQILALQNSGADSIMEAVASVSRKKKKMREAWSTCTEKNTAVAVRQVQNLSDRKAGVAMEVLRERMGPKLFRHWNETRQQLLKLDPSLRFSGGSETPLSSGGSEIPLRSGGSETPLSSGGSETPLSSGGSETPLSLGGSETPLSSGGSETPLSSDGSDIPFSSGGSKTTLSLARRVRQRNDDAAHVLR